MNQLLKRRFMSAKFNTISCKHILIMATSNKSIGFKKKKKAAENYCRGNSRGDV